MPIQYVDADTLRRIYNHNRLWERAQSGEFEERVLSEGRPARSSAEPKDAISRRVGYFDHTGRQVAVVHEYVRRGGKLGASQQPDPKSVRIGNTIYLTSTGGF
jgi:hypothetical protein